MKLESFNRVDNLSPTQQLMILACVANSNVERENIVRSWEEQVVIEDIDFSSSRLIPYFFHGNQQHGITTKHDQRLKVIYKHWWLRSQHISHELKKTHDALSDAGIVSVVIKGASIKLFYERDELRPMADFDLLVRPADLERALQIIKELGYLPNEDQERSFRRKKSYFLDFYHAITCTHQNNHTQLDLHWRIGSRCSVQFSNQLWLHLQNYDAIPNAKKPQLAYEVSMIIIHAASSRNRDNLNWIVDIDIINKQMGLSFWKEAREIAAFEKKEDLFDYGCDILLKLGVFAPKPKEVRLPPGFVATAPDQRHHMSYIRLTYLRVRNMVLLMNRLFPHSNGFVKSYYMARRFCYWWSNRMASSKKVDEQVLKS